MDLYDYSGQRSSRRTTGSEHHHNYSGGDAHSRHADSSAHHAEGKLRSEAVNEWFHQSEKARHKPLTVHHDGTYTVGHGDCLSTIAERRLRKDGEHINGKSVDKEVHRLRELNKDRYPTLVGHTQKHHRDFLADGWKLKVYDGHGPHGHDPHGHDRHEHDPHGHDPQGHKRRPHVDSDHHTDMPPAPYPQFDPRHPPEKRKNRNPGADDRNLESGDRNPESGNRNRESGKRNPASDDRNPESDNRNPESDNRNPYGDRNPAYGDRNPAYGDRNPAYGDRNPAYGDRNPTYGDPPRDQLGNIIGDVLSIPERIIDGVEQGVDRVLRSVTRERFYNNQKHSYDCGPTALGMAIGDRKLGRPPSDAEVNSLCRQTGTGSDGLPDWERNLPRQLKNNGLNAQSYTFRTGDRNAMNQLDRELAQGHSAIVHVNNPLTGNGHFIYVAGMTANGAYIIGDPNRRGNSLGHDKPISRQHLEDMMVRPPRQHPSHYKGTPGFTAVW